MLSLQLFAMLAFNYHQLVMMCYKIPAFMLLSKSSKGGDASNKSAANSANDNRTNEFTKSRSDRKRKPPTDSKHDSRRHQHDATDDAHQQSSTAVDSAVAEHRVRSSGTGNAAMSKLTLPDSSTMSEADIAAAVRATVCSVQSRRKSAANGTHQSKNNGGAAAGGGGKMSNATAVESDAPVEQRSKSQSKTDKTNATPSDNTLEKTKPDTIEGNR